MKRSFLKIAALALLLCCGNLYVVEAENLGRKEAKVALDSASYYVKTGKYERALQFLRKIESGECLYSQEQIDVQLLILQATVARAEYAQAMSAYQRALDLAMDKASEDQIRLVAGDLYLQMGNYKEGCEMLEKIKTDSLKARKYIQQARMLCGQGRYAAAVDSLMLAQTMNKDRRFENIIIQNIGYAYWAMGELTKADSYMAQAQQNMQHNKDYNYYVVLENRAIVHSQLGAHTNAVAEMAEAMKYFEKYSANYQISLRKYGEVLMRADKPKAALPYFERYFKEKRGEILANLPEMTLQQRLNLWAKERPLLSKCFMLEDNASEFLFEVAMFRRQLSLLGKSYDSSLLSVTPSQIRASMKADEAAVELIRYTDKSGEEWYAAIVLPKVGRARFVKLLKVSDIYEPEIVGKQSIYNVIKREEKSEINYLYSSKVLGDFIWEPILSSISAKTKKIFFAPEGIFNMWGIENMPFTNKEKIELYRVSSTTSLINRGSNSALDFGKSTKLVIGGLDYDITILGSANGTPDRAARDLLTEQTGCDGGFFNYLKGTFVESKSVAELCKSQAHHQIGELKIKSIMSDYGIIHIATHGYSLSTHVAPTPEFLLDSLQYDRSLSACGIAMSGANVSVDANSEDGILSAKEICEMDLSNVAFVVLSACQTAKGDIMDDGAAGLVRGLKNAGVKTILATLWSIEDNSTLLFMQEFYRLLSNGKTPHVALQMAQKTLMESSHVTYRRKFSPKTLAPDRKVLKQEEIYDKPYYYAPFILIDAIK